ncbi:MAG: hypothetical protein KF889_27680 [Alphaproteobacteria bacterium]|nr:hypothetical protein [Alphaproteobacteria bacterium]MCW5743736.1 hypothetical protein [Alphaproteobacteria bacterium]
MAGRIRIPPYKPLGVSTQAVPGGGYLAIDAIAGQFGPSPMLQLGLQAAEGAAGVAAVLSEHLAGDNEAIVKDADARLGEAEQALLFDSQTGYLNLQGQDALTQAPAVIDAYREAQAREMATMVDDDQRQMLQDLSERRLASFNTQIERHTEAERLRWYDEAGERRIAQMQADARLHWSDDAMLRRALGTTRAEVREQAERHGWDSALTEATLRRQTSRTLVSAIEAAVEHDPERARSLRARYEQHIEASNRAGLDALLAEAQTREHARQASAAILNATPPGDEPSVPQWRLRQAEAIADPAVRAATIRTLHSAAAADEAHARTLAEQVLARVLKDGLTDPAQIPVRDWVTLDTDHRQAIETRLDHNARGTEPVPNPALVDALATEMTQAPHIFARRDLVPTVAQLPLPQWQRFRDWQAGIRRSDPTTENELYAIKRGLQIARQTSTEANPARDGDKPSSSATDVKFPAALVEEIDTARKLNGKPPDDAALREIVRRSLPVTPVHNIVMPHLDPETLRRVAKLPRQVVDELMLFMMWLFMNGIIMQMQMARPLSPPAQISPSEEPDDDEDESEPSSDPAKPPSNQPSSPPPVPPPPVSTPGQQPQPSRPSTPPPGGGSHPLERILRPNGRDIGAQGSSSKIRLVSKAEFDRIEAALKAASTPISPPPRYSGDRYGLTQGGNFGVRNSKRWGPTLDVDHPSFPPGYRIHIQ